MSDDIPDIPHERPKRRRRSGVSLVWLVPVAALLVALKVAYSTYTDRGPLIRISFADAAGILAGETELRFRNVAVGVVEDVTFNEDLTRVLVDVRVENEVAPFLDERAEFWIVRPQVTASGVTGLQTVLSGVYLEGSWDNEAEGVASSFIGLEEAPLATANISGTRFELRSTRPSGLNENTPILFKGIEVGRLGPARISRDGSAVFAEAIIFEPHDRLVSTATRFWDASGFSVSIGAQGAEIDFSSLAALISGGITFDTLVSGGQPLSPGLVFQVFPDEASARNSIFEEGDGETVTFTMIFNENVSGLAAESPVEWSGVRVGRIVNVTGTVDRERFGDARVRLLATAQVRPGRIGLVGEVSREEALDYLEERVAAGLRARLASGSLLTGGLKIELVLEEEPTPAIFDRNAEPFPLFPVTESDIADVTASAEGVLSRVSALPVEELLSSAIAFLDNATALVASEGLREAPREILGLLGDARGVIGSDEVQAIPGDVRALLEELRGASTDLRNVLAEFQEAGAVERVLAAIDGLGTAAEAANAALAGAPELISQVTALAEEARALPIADLLSEATDVAAAAQAFVSSETFTALPGDVQIALAEITALLGSVDEAGTVGALTTTLSQAGSAAQAVESALADVPPLIDDLRGTTDAVDSALEGVPALTARVTTLAETANALPLERLLTEASSLAADFRVFLASESFRALPGSVQDTLASLTGLLDDAEEAGTVAALTATISEAGAAAETVSASFEGVPALIARLDAIAENAQEVELGTLATELEGILATASQVLADTSEAELPEALAQALAEAQGALADLRAGGLIDSANATLASARSASAAIESAAVELPAVVDQLNATLAQAQRTLADLDGDSRISRETSAVLREIERAAKAISNLARTIERRPNSILIGR